jgi:plasmid replication initiation protein
MTKSIIKSKTPKVYKNKKLNSANFGNYNLNDYQVFLQLVSKIGGVDELGKYLQPEQLQREHVLTAKEFSVQFNLDIAGTYKVLQKAGNRLARTALTLQKPELFETWDIAVCEISKYNHKEGSLSIKFTESIMPYLAQVKQKFVIYNLKEVANFGSLYTTRLYELIQEFKDTGYIIKSLEQLREIFAVGSKYKSYKDFKVKTFGHATAEINSQYELNLKFTEIKTSKRVTSIHFEFNPTFTKRIINPHTGNERNHYIKPKRKTTATDPIINPNQLELPIRVV